MSGLNINVELVFDTVRRIKDKELRADYVEQVCLKDPALKARVSELLSLHEEEESLFSRPPQGLPQTLDASQISEKPGNVIGPYKLLQQIGEGGMGVVYMAEQTQPVKRRVALKIIKPGMDSKQVIARFEAERQALAMMDHPNIAKVLDAGTTDSGRPYFVMELVKGVTITDYCDEHHLTPKERLKLFLPVLQAVQHAHQKGIIHRDIKPSNVLVAEYDNQAVPKVIDFGVAKATNQLLTDKTMFTQYGQLIGTLEYMSPEQAKLNQMDIDTRSDIYSLGVLLYELLTGDTPFDRKRLRSAAFDEMLRIIRDEEPPRPSIRLTTSTMLASVSANRSTEPRKLSTLVRGELDWIVMKAMEKERSRRYETPNAFADDIQRFLKQEAITARPASAAYRLKKFTQRNRTLVMAGSFIASTLLLGFGISTWQAILADQERNKAEQARIEAVNAKDRAEKVEIQSSKLLAISTQHEAEAESARKAESAERAIALEERDKAKALSLELTNEKTQLSRQKEELRRAHYAASMNLIPAAWQAVNVKRVAEMLEEQKPAPGEEDLRGFEWHYWDRLCHPEHPPINLGLGFAGNKQGPVEGIGYFSGNGERFFSFKEEIRERKASVIVMRVINSSNGKEVTKWDFANSAGNLVSIINEDGTRLAQSYKQVSGGEKLASEREVRVLDTNNGAEIFKQTIAYAIRVALSRDGKRLAVGIVRTGSREIVPETETKYSDISIWDLDAPEREPQLLKGEDRYGIMALIFSPDGSRLISAENVYPSGDETIESRLCIWDTTNGKRCASLLMKDHFITSIALSPNGSRLAGIGRSGPTLFLGRTNIYNWDVSADDELKLLRTDALKDSGLSMNFSRLIFHPDGQRLLAWGDPSGTKLIDTAAGTTLHSYKSTSNFLAAAFASDGTRLLTVGAEHAQPSGTNLPPSGNLLLQQWDVPSPHSEKNVASHVTDTQVIWNRSHTRYASAGQFFFSTVNAPKSDPPTGERREVTICDSAGKAIQVFREHSQPITSLKFSFDDRYVWSQAGMSGSIEAFVWEADSGIVRWSQKLSVDAAQNSNPVTFSINGKLMALPESDDTRIVSTADWKTKFVISSGHVLFFSRDGRRLMSRSSTRKTDKQSNFDELNLWDVDTGKIVKTFPNSTCKGFSDDGHRIATSGDSSKEINIWDTETGEKHSIISGQDKTSRVFFNPDGSRLLTTSSMFINNGDPRAPEVWDSATGKLLFRLEGIDCRALSGKGIAFSPDGKRIATASVAATNQKNSQMEVLVKIWDSNSGREFLNLACQLAIKEIEFGKDGHRLTARGVSLTENFASGPMTEKTWEATPREHPAQAMQL